MVFRTFRSNRVIRSDRRMRQDAGRIELLERRTLLSTTLTPVADADVRNATGDVTAVDSNYGADAKLRVRLSPDETLETFLTFDVSSITTVGHALLRMNGGQGAAVAAPDLVLVGAFATPDEFTEGTGTHGSPLSILPGVLGGITFNNRPASGGAAFGSAIVTTSGDYYWDLTEYVRASKTTGDNLVTIGLRHTGGGSGEVSFGSREAAVGVAPQLIVEENDAGPKAAFFSPDITTAGGATQEIVVTYTDIDPIDTASFDAGDIEVRRPGGQPLEVTGMSVNAPDANSAIVTYTVAAPGGTWDADDAHSFITLLMEGAVKDLAGNPATGGPDVFTNLIPAEPPPPPPPTDTEKPKTQITGEVDDISVAGGTGTTVAVRFTDNVGIDADDLKRSSLVITKGGGPSGVEVLDLATTPSADGKTLDVLFNVVAPGGSWDSADSGTYQLEVVAGAVTDPAGNASEVATQTFTVAIVAEPPPPPPPDPDTAGPETTVVPLEPFIEEGGADHQIRVTFIDNVAVNLATIDVGDIVVTSPSGTTLNVLDVSVSPPTGGGSVTATYTVAAPGDLWEVGDNGTYTITLAAGAAADTSGNASSAATANLTVAIPEPLPPVDPTFGSGATNTVNTGFVAEAAVAQNDGKIIVAGRQGDLVAGTSQLVLKRLNSDGSFDQSFGTGGTVLGAQGANEAAYAVAIDADGSIVVAGRRGDDMMVARYRANGTLDTRFGTGGVATANFEGTDVAYSLVIGPDGAIVLAGGSTQAGGDAFAFARFLRDGRADPFFGTNGLSLFSQGTSGNVAASVALDSTGRIVAAGPGENGNVAVVRLGANGAQDASFGANGILVLTGLMARTDLGRPDRSIGIVALADGSLLVTNHTAGDDFAVAKVKADGTLDTSFGNQGVAVVDFGGEDDADAILVQATGEIIALGTTTAGGNRLAVAALSAGGTLIQSFGDGGKLTIETQPVSSARELHLGDLVLRAFGSVTSSGRLVVGLSDQQPAAVSSTPLQRLNVPGSGSLGTFGQVNGIRKGKKLIFQDNDGTVVTISMKGAGSGQAFYDGASLDLVLGGVGNSSIVIKTVGGDGRLSLRNVMADGNLKAVTAKTTDLVGTFSVMNGGGIGKVSLGNLTGTLATAGSIGTAAFAGDVKGKVLSGANYGVNGKPGGAGTAADTFSAGRIGKVTVTGSVIGGTFAAGVDPVNQRLLDGNDQLVGGAASSIGAVMVKQGADPSTRFIAGAFAKRVKLPQGVNPLDDPRFMLL